MFVCSSHSSAVLTLVWPPLAPPCPPGRPLGQLREGPGRLGTTQVNMWWLGKTKLLLASLTCQLDSSMGSVEVVRPSRSDSPYHPSSSSPSSPSSPSSSGQGCADQLGRQQGDLRRAARDKKKVVLIFLLIILLIIFLLISLSSSSSPRRW